MINNNKNILIKEVAILREKKKYGKGKRGLQLYTKKKYYILSIIIIINILVQSTWKSLDFWIVILITLNLILSFQFWHEMTDSMYFNYLTFKGKHNINKNFN